MHKKTLCGLNFLLLAKFCSLECVNEAPPSIKRLHMNYWNVSRVLYDFNSSYYTKMPSHHQLQANMVYFGHRDRGFICWYVKTKTVVLVKALSKFPDRAVILDSNWPRNLGDMSTDLYNSELNSSSKWTHFDLRLEAEWE